MSENSTALQEPVVVANGEGEARWWFAALAEIKATAADTNGQMSIVEITEPPGAEAPLHVHHHEDEAFWILDGSATFEVGDLTIEAGVGDYLYGPRDIPHRYTVGPDGCRMLFILLPGGFEKMVTEMSEPAGSRTLPPAPESEPSDEEMQAMMAEVGEIAARHGNELLA